MKKKKVKIKIGNKLIGYGLVKPDVFEFNMPQPAEVVSESHDGPVTVKFKVETDTKAIQSFLHQIDGLRYIEDKTSIEDLIAQIKD